MSTERRDINPHHPTPPVYTVYTGNQPNLSYGFHPTNPHAPPPKYEDVISGRPGQPIAIVQPAGTYEGSEQTGVIFVAPAYKYTKTQRFIGIVFTLLFVVAFLSVLIKILSVQSKF